MLTFALTPEQITRIHQASLAILERTGVVVPHDDMLGRFADAGARVDHNAQRVRIPADLTMRLVDQAGREFAIYGRDVTKVARFGAGTRNFNSSAGQASWVDALGATRRYPSIEDVANAARFCDALSHVNVVGAMADPHEMDVAWRCVEVMATMLRQTTKPITFWYHDRASARYLNELLIALRGDTARAEAQPVCYPFFEPISPLRFPFNGIDLLYETSKLNLPVPVGPMAQMGLTAPMSVAGTMAQQHAEVLAGICITQLIRPGMPVCYGGVCHAFDMATTQMIFSGPEQAIFGAAMTQIGKHLGFPVYVNTGLTDSKQADAQAGLEVGVTLAYSVASGADIYGHMGICGMDQGASLEMLLLQNEIISFVTSATREIDFSDEALGLDVIDEVGPGGNFIDHEHTAEFFRQELWFPKLLDRQFYQPWLDDGARTMGQRCRQRVGDILATHTPEPISPEIDQAFREITAAARKDLGTK